MTRTINRSVRLSPEANAAAISRAALERRPVASLLALILEDELTVRTKDPTRGSNPSDRAVRPAQS